MCHKFVMLLGANTSDYSDQLSISYDPVNALAIISTQSPLPFDKFRLGLSDSISSATGGSLDGDLEELDEFFRAFASFSSNV